MLRHENICPQVIESLLSAALEGIRHPLTGPVTREKGSALKAGEGQAVGLAFDVIPLASLSVNFGHGASVCGDSCLRKRRHGTRHLYPATERMRFLGQVVSRTRRRLPGENVRRFRRRLQKWRKCPPENMDQRIASWLGHAKQANTMGLLRTLSRSNLPTFHARSQ